MRAWAGSDDLAAAARCCRATSPAAVPVVRRPGPALPAAGRHAGAHRGLVRASTACRRRRPAGHGARASSTASRLAYADALGDRRRACRVARSSVVHLVGGGAERRCSASSPPTPAGCRSSPDPSRRRPSATSSCRPARRRRTGRPRRLRALVGAPRTSAGSSRAGDPARGTQPMRGSQDAEGRPAWSPASTTRCSPRPARPSCALLRRLGVDVEFPAAQTCCGQPMSTPATSTRPARRADLRRRVRGLRRHRHAVGVVRGIGRHQHPIVARTLGRRRPRRRRRGDRRRGPTSSASSSSTCSA